MTVKYQIRCSESDIYVLKKQDGYQVTIGSRVNPLSYGNRIADYGTLGRAVDAAEQFCRLYTAFKTHGYHLDKDAFCKEGSPNVSVHELLEVELTDEAIETMLKSRAAASLVERQA